MHKEQTFGSYLSEKRLQCGLSKMQLGKRIGVTNTYIAQMESGLRKPFDDLERLENMAALLQLTPQEKERFLNLAWNARNIVAPDLPNYINENDYVSKALRKARDMGAGEEEWLQFINELENKENKQS